MNRKITRMSAKWRFEKERSDDERNKGAGVNVGTGQAAIKLLVPLIWGIRRA
jgi:hypothetical protein